MTGTTTIVGLNASTSADSAKPTGAGTPADALEVTKRMSTSNDSSNQSDDHVCPECGKELKNQHGMRIHYTNTHEGRLATTQKCEWCGDSFEKRPNADRVFCSNKCRGEHRSENGLPARSRQVTLVCEQCGEDFDVPQCDAKASKKYCSTECYANDSAAESLSCEWCGDEFRAHGKMVDKRRFCSQDCYGQWMANEMPTEQHARYKGEDKLSKPHYGAGWNEEKRTAVRERDGHRCAACGLSSGEHQQQYGAKLNVHHIVPARKFDDASGRNAMTNLVALCIPCHRKWEGIPLRPEVA